MPDDLTPERLAEIEAWFAARNIPHADLVTIRSLCAALRSAWAERDFLRPQIERLGDMLERAPRETAKAMEDDMDVIRSARDAALARAEAAERRNEVLMRCVSEKGSAFRHVAEAAERDRDGCRKQAQEAAEVASENAKERDAALALVAEMKALLTEWRDTEFFDDKKDWQEWVDDFGLRVDHALEPRFDALDRLTARIEARVWGDVVSRMQRGFLSITAAANAATVAQARAEGR